jgi:hypothetical protein
MLFLANPLTGDCPMEDSRVSQQPASAASFTGTDLGVGRLDVAGVGRSHVPDRAFQGETGAADRSERVRHAVDEVAAKAHGTVDRLASTANRLVNQVDAGVQRAAKGPKRAWAASLDVVQTHPVQVVAASLAMGFVLGWLSAARRSKFRHD